jgi:hypothetical protein
MESNWVHSALQPLIGLLCQPQVIMMMGNWWNDWQGKLKYLEKTCHFVHHKPHMLPGRKPRPLQLEHFWLKVLDEKHRDPL